MDVEPRVGPREHVGRLGRVEELKAHEEPEHGAAKRLRQARGVMGGPRDKRPVGPEPAVRDEQVQVRMPVGARAMRPRVCAHRSSRAPTGRARTRASHDERVDRPSCRVRPGYTVRLVDAVAENVHVRAQCARGLIVAAGMAGKDAGPRHRRPYAGAADPSEGPVHRR